MSHISYYVTVAIYVPFIVKMTLFLYMYAFKDYTTVHSGCCEVIKDHNIPITNEKLYMCSTYMA